MKEKMDFILNTQERNSHSVIVLTEGIDYTDFNSNPVMLFNHNIDTVLGNWENVRVENSNLIASAKFDEEDSEAIKISKKVKKGIIKGASVGLDVLEFILPENDGDAIIVTKSVLYEASITPLPSNKSALKLTYKNNQMEVTKDKTAKDIKLFFSKEGSNSDAIEAMKATEESKVEVTVEATEKPVEATIETKVIDEEVTDKVVDEVAEKDAKVNDETTVSDVPKVMTFTKEQFSELENKLKVETLELTKAKNEVLELSKKNEELTAKLNTYKQVEQENLIDNAILEGKFNTEQRESLLELAKSNFTLLEQLMSKATIVHKPGLVLNKVIKDSDKTDEKLTWNFMDWQTKDPSGLKLMKETNENKYLELYNKHINKQ